MQRALILSDVIALRKAAVGYAHPEVGVSSSDPSMHGYNDFNHLFAPEVEDEDIEEQAQILANVRALKMSAVDYAHPEVRVTSSDPTLLQWLC